TGKHRGHDGRDRVDRRAPAVVAASSWWRFGASLLRGAGRFAGDGWVLSADLGACGAEDSEGGWASDQHPVSASWGSVTAFAAGWLVGVGRFGAGGAGAGRVSHGAGLVGGASVWMVGGGSGWEVAGGAACLIDRVGRVG